MPRSVLTDEHKKYIRKNCKKLSSRKMANYCGCSRSVIQYFQEKNGLTPSKKIQYGFRSESLRGRTSFTLEEDTIIRENYLKSPIKRLAKKIGRSYVGVVSRMKAMGLVIPDDVRERNIAAGRIKKGAIPPNKGKKQIEYMSSEAINKSSKTWFKKGNLPHNTKSKNGIISVRKDNRGVPYKHIRMQVGKWIHYHRYKWEKVNGKIPTGMMVTFKDGDTLNCDINNLELISKAENAVRNKTGLPLELARAIIIHNKLKTKIKQYEEQDWRSAQPHVRGLGTIKRRNGRRKVKEGD